MSEPNQLYDDIWVAVLLLIYLELRTQLARRGHGERRNGNGDT